MFFFIFFLEFGLLLKFYQKCRCFGIFIICIRKILNISLFFSFANIIFYILETKKHFTNYKYFKKIMESQNQVPANTTKPTKKMSLDDFLLLSVIGKGSYAKVVLIKKKDNGKIFALKILKKKYIEKRKQEEHVLTERNVLVGAKHAFIIKLFYTFMNEKKLFFVLEYCPGGELFNLLQKRRQFTEEQYLF